MCRRLLIYCIFFLSSGISGLANVSVTGILQNAAPVITGQSALSTNEQVAITLMLSDLQVEDPDNLYPDDFTLTVMTGENYSVEGSTITPGPDFNGTLSVPVTVNDGTNDSQVYHVQIGVSAVNDKPVITGQVPLQTPESQPLTLMLEHLTVSDPDNSYPADFTLSVSGGSDYSVSGTTITPDDDFVGFLSVQVSVHDGADGSDSFNLQVEVSGTNDPPVITGQVASETVEEKPFTITLGHLTVADADNAYPDDFTLIVSGGANYDVSGTTVTPVKDFNGPLSVSLMVSDGAANSAPFDFVLQVLAENDPPEITGQTPLAVDEDQSIAIELSHLTINDADNAPGDFSLTVTEGANYTISNNVVAPATNFSGELTVSISVSDGMSSSQPFNLKITVNPVNDPPVISGQGVLTVAEESSLTLGLSDFSVSDPDNAYPGGFSLLVGNGENYSVNGTTITPVADFTGVLSVPVNVNDGAALSPVFTAQVNVGNVNDRPQITGQVALAANEEQALTIQLNHLTVEDNDNTYPQGFTLKLSNGVNYTVNATTVIPATDFFGDLSVPVIVNDGNSDSDPFDVRIAVYAVNDAPVITGQAPLSTYRNKSLTIQLTDLIVRDPDSSFPEDFFLTVGSGPNYSVQQNTITPAKDFAGELSIPVTVSDGQASSPAFSIKVNVEIPPNVRPEIVSQVTLTTYMNEPILLELSHLVVSDPDNIFPDDFTLSVFGGAHYTLNGNQIVPETDYSGYLNVGVTVSDKESTSDLFYVSIEVFPVTVTPLITSQEFIRTMEDGTLVLKLSDVTVSDPDNNYPTGFTMAATEGANYTLSGLEVRPAPDFNGYLSVPITVNDGEHTSAPYQLRILVDAINDAPVITDTDPVTLFYTLSDDFKVFNSFSIQDVDDDTLTSALITIKSNFQDGLDTLIVVNTPAIRGIYNGSGNMVIFGSGSVDEYQNFINSVVYTFKGTLTESLSKVFGVTVNDGKGTSAAAEKTVSFDVSSLRLDIPGGFTPNGDGANDTWNIRASAGQYAFENAIVRVYTKKGVMVFEGRGLTDEWDGKFNGNLLPADSYFYTIDLHGPYGRNRYKGIVTILR